MLNKVDKSKIALSLGLIALVSVPFAFRLTAEEPVEASATRVLPTNALMVNIEEGYFAKRTFTGRAVAGRVSSLAFEVGGTLTDIKVDLGAKVAKGDTLATLDNSLLAARRAELLADRDEATANLDLAKRTLTRVERTFKQGHTSAQRRDEAEANTIALKARVARLEAAIKSMDTDIARTVLKAPFDGTVTLRAMDEGTITGAGQMVLELSEDARLEAQIGMPTKFATNLPNGTPYSLLDANREPIAGTQIRSVVPVIDGTTRTMMVSFDLPQNAVARGELITAVVQDWQATEGAWVPMRALSADVRGLWRLYKIMDGPDGPSVKFENVQVHYSTKGQAFVSGTISDGDVIVSDGVAKLAPGQRVSVLNSTTVAAASK
jgi:RND family efflux transporter MFP subunit